jgi:hypothetical protein
MRASSFVFFPISNTTTISLGILNPHLLPVAAQFKLRILSKMKLNCLFVLLVCSILDSSTGETKNLNNLNYSVYPRRTEEEAAEVEAMPILASPLNGVGNRYGDDEDGIPIRELDNTDEVHGNMVVMTNNGGLSAFGMAKVAKLSGAAALLIVNIDEGRPDDIYRLEALEGESTDEIDIPVVMISLNSANVLTTATVEQGMKKEDIVNNGMPERVRLYAGGDRPFFEDVEPMDPTLYLIHNLMTDEEADTLVRSAESKVSPIEEDDVLQFTVQKENFPNVDRAVLWSGLLQTTGQKAIEERIEQVTGFPSAHHSDFVIDRLDAGAHWKPHYDTHPYLIPMATITVFLTDNGGPVVYPSAKDPVKITPTKGMAIVHHNTDNKHNMDFSSLHAMMEGDNGPAYVARKYVFTTPISNARRIVLPIFALPFGGKLPGFISSFHDLLIEQFGEEQGTFYFDKACVFIPILIILAIAQFISERVQAQVKSKTVDKKKSEKNTRRGKKGNKKD